MKEMKNKIMGLGVGFFLLFSGIALADEGTSAQVMDTLEQRTEQDTEQETEQDTGNGNFWDGIGLGSEKLWRVRPGFEFGTVYDSNINRETQGNRDTAVILNYVPSIDLKRIGSLFGLVAEYNMLYQQYLQDSDQSALNHRLNSRMWYKGDRLTATLSERFGWVKTYATSEQSERRTVIFNDFNPEIIYHLSPKTSLSAIYRNYFFHYTDSILKANSYIQDDIGGRVYYHATDKTDLFVQGSAIFTDYYRSGPYDSDGYGAYGGAVGRVTDKILLNLKTGFEARDYEDGAINSFNNWVGEMGLRYNLTSKIDATLVTKRGIGESVYRDTAWYTFNRARLGLEYRLTHALTAELGGSFQNNRYSRHTVENPAGTAETKKRDDDIVTADFKLKWGPWHHWDLGTGYIYSSRFSNFDIFDYVDHTVEASASYKF